MYFVIEDNTMIVHQDTPFQKAIEAVESFPTDDLEELIELLKFRLAEY